MAKWGKLGQRGNVDDRRGISMSKGSLGVGGIVAILAIGFFAGPETALQVFNTVQNSGIGQQQVRSPDAAQFEGSDSYEQFASTVLGSNDAFWSDLLAQGSIPYQKPTLVLFRDYTNSACGGASSAIGPHYCPTDQTIYLDETFFEELTKRYGAEGGDVAEAYVLSHEVGHHVQNILGLEKGVARTNENSIKTELQADCFAGFWAGSLKDQGVFEPGEIGEAIDAAEAVGDDRIQEAATGRVNPESWTHGSSDDRKKWFTIGYDTTDLSTCDTFAS
ncbi:hypothetical protein GW846_00345 [Candidatus Gracilibacteria bacterium]|nr:hypothetical protein [Candidatus Gracilibacteria bacterium]